MRERRPQARRNNIEEPEDRLNTIRIYTLARELKLSNAEVLEAARSQGANVSTASSAITEAIAAAIREHHSKREPSHPVTPRGHGSRKAATAPADNKPAEPAQTVAPSRQSHSRQRAPQSAPAPHKKQEEQAAAVLETLPAPQPDHSRSKKRLYLVDGLNVCNWTKTPSLAPLLTLLIELKLHGNQFLCIFDANTRFVLEDLGERDKYEQLLHKYDCFGEVPGGTQADDFLLYRAHKTGDAIVTNDQYRDQKYRERYKWLRSVSPRLCKGMVLGGFLILPELDVHARIRESLPGVMKDFEDAFGSGSERELPADRRQAHGAHRRRPQAQQKVSANTAASSAPAETKVNQPAPPPPVEPMAATDAQVVPQDANEQRPRSRRRRRRGRRGGGGGQGGNGGTSAGEGASSAG